MRHSFDHSFQIGEQHLRQGKPCQDYALSGTFENNAVYAIVSDGCSSGGRTDIGARLVALSMQHALTDGHGGGLATITNRMYGYLASAQHLLALPDRDMLATALVAVVYPCGNAFVHVLGDGVIAYVDDDMSDVFALKYEWALNTPFYPSYQGALREQFTMLHGPNATPLVVEKWRVAPTPELINTRTHSLLEGAEGIIWDHEPTRGPQHSGHQTVAVFSDGVTHVDGYTWQEVVGHLMAFKSPKGQFATRRMNRFLQEAKKRGRGPLDDIAMAVIHLGKEDQA